jgi:hypothetical protein
MLDLMKNTPIEKLRVGISGEARENFAPSGAKSL